jgi:hypothetical protein
LLYLHIMCIGAFGEATQCYSYLHVETYMVTLGETAQYCYYVEAYIAGLGEAANFVPYVQMCSCF